MTESGMRPSSAHSRIIVKRRITGTPSSLHAQDAVADHRAGRRWVDVAQHVVGSDLPDDEFGIRGDDVAVDACQSGRRGFAANAAIEDLDVGARQPPRQ
jgi:hypothetical protein